METLSETATCLTVIGCVCWFGSEMLAGGWPPGWDVFPSGCADHCAWIYDYAKRAVGLFCLDLTARYIEARASGSSVHWGRLVFRSLVRAGVGTIASVVASDDRGG